MITKRIGGFALIVTVMIVDANHESEGPSSANSEAGEWFLYECNCDVVDADGTVAYGPCEGRSLRQITG